MNSNKHQSSPSLPETNPPKGDKKSSGEENENDLMKGVLGGDTDALEEAEDTEIKK
jgi:hypothetical protein